MTEVIARRKRGKEKKSAQTEICSGFIEFSLRLFRRLKWYFLAGFEPTIFYSAHASLSAKREQMRQLPEFMMLTGLETRDDESADREELHRLSVPFP